MVTHTDLNDQPTPESLCSSGGGALADPRSNAAEVPGRALLTLDQGSGQVVCVSLAIILSTFAGVDPIRIYSFVSAINPQMRLNIIYNP